VRSIVGLLIALALAAPARASRAPRPAVELLALNTHETFALRPGHGGHFALRGWDRFLRCHHTGRVHAMAHRLAALLYETAEHFSFRKILVIAGYRAPKIARQKGNPKSPHKQGLACDFRVEGVPNEEVRDYLRTTFAKVGVGYYPHSDFVHLDVGRKKSAFWIDYSGPGERARYAPREDDLGGAEPQDPPDSGDETPSAVVVDPPTP
jgi:uncharacterized protein YcbK (DUF882 family)